VSELHALVVLPDGHGDVGNVGGERIRPVVTVVVAAGRLILAAHVDRNDAAAGCRDWLEHSQEVFLAARVAGDQKGGPSLAYAAAGHRLKRREGSAAGLNRDSSYLLRQVESPWCAHGVAAYPG
jgi:hypothetical protein